MYHEARSQIEGNSLGDLGLLLGDAVRLHRRIEQTSSEVKGDYDKERARDRAMELAQRRISTLQEAISHGRAATLADALAQTVVAYDLTAELDENLDANLKQTHTDLQRVLFSIAGALQVHTGLTVEALGADYMMPAWADYLAPWYAPNGIVKLGLSFEQTPTDAVVRPTTTKTSAQVQPTRSAVA